MTKVLYKNIGIIQKLVFLHNLELSGRVGASYGRPLEEETAKTHTSAVLGKKIGI